MIDPENPFAAPEKEPESFEQALLEVQQGVNDIVKMTKELIPASKGSIILPSGITLHRHSETTLWWTTFFINFESENDNDPLSQAEGKLGYLVEFFIVYEQKSSEEYAEIERIKLAAHSDPESKPFLYILYVKDGKEVLTMKDLDLFREIIAKAKMTLKPPSAFRALIGKIWARVSAIYQPKKPEDLTKQKE